MTAIHEITKSSRISYLDIHIDVDQNKCDDLKLCNMQLKMLIDNALLTLYGERQFIRNWSIFRREETSSLKLFDVIHQQGEL